MPTTAQDAMTGVIDNPANVSPRGRKPLPPSGAAVPEPLQPSPLLKEAQALDAELVRVATVNQLQVSETIGRIQAFEFIHKFTGLAQLKWLADAKETKAYKGCKGLGKDGQLKELRTFEDLCEAVGTSRAKINEDLQNLAVFGEEFLEASQRMGLGYRELRKLRALPEDDRKLIIEGEAVAANDPESLKDVIEDLAARNAKVKAELKEKDADLAAREEVLADKNKKLDTVQTELAKLKTYDPDARLKFRGEKEKEALNVLGNESGRAFSAVANFLAFAKSVIVNEEITPQTRELAEGVVSQLASSMADQFANELPFIIQFEELVYPDWTRDKDPENVDAVEE